MRKFLMVLAATAFTGSATGVLAEEAAAPVDAKKKVAEVCAACHGEDGNLMATPDTPKLGGQKGDYLAKALRDYKSGARKNPIMGAMAATLTKEEIRALADYFSGQKGELVSK